MMATGKEINRVFEEERMKSAAASAVALNVVLAAALLDARKELAALRDLANAVIPSDFDGTGCEDVGGVNWFDRRVALGGECPYAQQRNRDAAFRAKYAIETTPGGGANNVPAARPK